MSNKDKIIYSVVFGLIISLTTYVFYQSDHSKNNKKQSNHINNAIVSNRNCNDCHLGTDFTKLFELSVVKDNSALTLQMLQNANLRTW